MIKQRDCSCVSDGGGVGPAVDAASSDCSQLLRPTSAREKAPVSASSSHLLRLPISAREEAPVSASSSLLLCSKRRLAAASGRSCAAAGDVCSVLGPPFRVAHKLEVAAHVVAAPMTVLADSATRGR
ncbi:hypothetical protein M9H77_35356 [Catharanthus roseus]|uniref:Uncharacterized protein n=1 Tax=Catharanthus roseus TaxID=4058 RepID=A0ACB9ZQ13_CATRO|nr:hypothetical protein M9H77_35356 [Catharanthus roseus]